MAVQIRKKKKKNKTECSINVLENSVYIWKKNEIKYLLHTPHKKRKRKTVLWIKHLSVNGSS